MYRLLGHIAPLFTAIFSFLSHSLKTLAAVGAAGVLSIGSPYASVIDAVQQSIQSTEQWIVEQGTSAGNSVRTTQETLTTPAPVETPPALKTITETPSVPTAPVSAPSPIISRPSISAPSAVERIVERIVEGISSGDLSAAIADVNARIDAETKTLSALVDTRAQSLFQNLSLATRINQLSGITMSNISGLSDSDIPNDITIATTKGISGTSASFSTNLGVSGSTTLAGFISSASSTVNGNLTVTGNLSMAALSITNNTLSFANGFISNASSSVGAGLQVGGALNASSTFQVAGASTLTGALSVSSLSTLFGGFISNASSSVGAGLQVGGALNASGTLQVANTFKAQGTIVFSAIGSCVGGSALQSDSNGIVSCGVVASGGSSSAGGWTFSAPNNVAVSTSTDRVGIGATSSPYAKLSILSGAAATTTLALVAASNQTAHILDIVNGSNVLVDTIDSTGLMTLGNGFISSASSTINGNLNVLGFLGASSTLMVSGNGTSSIANGLTIATSGGLVGIGTSTPDTKLAVFSTVSSAQFRLNYDASTFSDFQIDSTGDLFIAPSGGDAILTNQNLWICSGGAAGVNGCPTGSPSGAGNLIVESKLGIGTSTPNWNLQIAGTRPFLTLSDTSAGTNQKHWFLSSQGGNLYMGTTTDGYATTSISAFTILNNGNVGIGTTTPYAPLSLHTTKDSTPMFAIGSTTPAGIFNSVFEITSRGTTTAPTGGSFTASSPCVTGYTRVGVWCLDTDGTLEKIRAQVTTHDAAYVSSSTVPKANPKMVMLKVAATATNGGTAGTNSIVACAIPGDSVGPSCTASGGEFGVQAIVVAAGDNTKDLSSVLIMTGSGGTVKTQCSMGPPVGGSGTCDWYVEGYVD